MAWIADAHRDWHAAFPDAPWDCPLDCGMAESMADAQEGYEDDLTGWVPMEAPAPIWGDPWAVEPPF